MIPVKRYSVVLILVSIAVVPISVLCYLGFDASLDSPPIVHRFPNAEIMYMNSFRGTVTSLTRRKRPEDDLNPFGNSGDLLSFTIVAENGDVFLITDFPSGKHGEEELDGLVLEGEQLFPDRLAKLREAIFVD